MKKIFKLLSITILSALIIGCAKKESYNFNGKTYKSLKDISENEIIEYARIPAFLYTEKDYSTFTDDDIALFVAYKLLMNNDTATSEEIQELVKNYFGKENYKLQSKEYLIDSELYDYIDHKVIISETNGTYKSNLGGRGLDNPINFLPKVTITDDKVTIDYIYGNQGKKLTDVESIIGYTKMEFKYNGNSLVLDKITYKETKEN